MRILTFSTLYPNAEQPRHGIFVEQRLRQLLSTSGVQARVVAPVPWFPWRGLQFGGYGQLARVARREKRYGIEVLHPRYPLIPKVGMSLAPFLMAMGVRSVMERLATGEFEFDLIDAHYFYPDGVAAALLGKWLERPVVITARGSDVNLLSNYRFPLRMMRWAARRSAAVIAVSNALKNRLVELGVPAASVSVLANGVDLDFFHATDGARLLAGEDSSGPLLLSVGNLVPGKGHHLAVEALRLLPHARLIIVGEGWYRGELERLAKRLNVADRLCIVEHVPQEELRGYYSSADALVLASEREGMPNVVLEAMACGTPVIATAVGGIPEILAGTEAGVLMRERSADAIAEAYHVQMSARPQRAAIRRYAERFDWSHTTQGQLALFTGILERQPSVARGRRGRQRPRTAQ